MVAAIVLVMMAMATMDDGGNGGDGGDGGGTMALSTSSEGYVIWDLGYYRLGCRVSANQQSFLNR